MYTHLFFLSKSSSVKYQSDHVPVGQIVGPLGILFLFKALVGSVGAYKFDGACTVAKTNQIHLSICLN
jgi:hypothetical protein